MPDGQTVGERVLPNVERAYTKGRMPPLLPAIGGMGEGEAMKLRADHRTVFETQYGMLGRQVAYFERAEDVEAYARLVNQANGEDALQILQTHVAEIERSGDNASRQAYAALELINSGKDIKASEVFFE